MSGRSDCVLVFEETGSDGLLLVSAPPAKVVAMGRIDQMNERLVLRRRSDDNGTCVKRARNVSDGRYMREILNIGNFAEDRVDRPEVPTTTGGWRVAEREVHEHYH